MQGDTAPCGTTDRDAAAPAAPLWQSCAQRLLVYLVVSPPTCSLFSVCFVCSVVSFHMQSCAQRSLNFELRTQNHGAATPHTCSPILCVLCILWFLPPLAVLRAAPFSVFCVFCGFFPHAVLSEGAQLRPFLGVAVVRHLVSCAEDVLKYTHAGETLSLIKLRLHKGARLYGDAEDASAGRATFCFSP